jgi:hypothetical protein
MRVVFVCLSAALMAVACSDQYRYPCQDPANWGKAQCNPPLCEANGTCTKDLVSEEALKGQTQ